MEVVQNSLSLFVPPPVDNTIEKEYWVEFNPIAAITDAGVIEFNIPGTSTDYVNLSKTKLHIKYVITKENGDVISAVKDQSGNYLDEVAPTNFTLHSIFRQVDVSTKE